ncbi:hypothetical protein TNCV_1126591 [Trichonephila clavipes]|nr:hypothetical protein TNCV_1126591 [Trichonephila clavipes]
MQRLLDLPMGCWPKWVGQLTAPIWNQWTSFLPSYQKNSERNSACDTGGGQEDLNRDPGLKSAVKRSARAKALDIALGTDYILDHLKPSET